MKNTIIRLLAALLVVLMLGAVLVSCVKPNQPDPEDPDEDEDINDNEKTDEVIYDEYGRVVVDDELPEKANYNRTFNVHMRGSDDGAVEASEWVSDGTGGDKLSVAVYNRNTSVEKRLGITINVTAEGTYANYQNSTMPKLATGIKTHTHANDLIAGFSEPISTWVTTGLILDLNKFEYIDFDKPWWNQNIVDTMSIGDKTFFGIGAMSTSMVYSLQCIVYNTKLLPERDNQDNVFNIYDCVLLGDWTVDKMVEIGAKAYVDAGDPGPSEGDTFGIGFGDFSSNTGSGYLRAFGLKTISKDNNGNPVINFSKKKASEILTRVSNLLYSTPCANTDAMSNEDFKEGEVLFYDTWLYYIQKTISTTDNYGIVPFPKYDKKSSYYTPVQSGMHMYCIPFDIGEENYEVNGIITEALAAESYRSLLPTYFEIVLKKKFALEQKDSQMIDMIYNNAAFDMGFTFDGSIGIFSIFKSRLQRPNGFSSSYDAKITGIKENLSKLVKGVEELP